MKALMDSALADRILNAALSHINIEHDGLSDVTCQWCGQAQWQVHALTRTYRLEDKRTIPTVTLQCATCGLLLTFDLKALGFEDLDVLQGRIAG